MESLAAKLAAGPPAKPVGLVKQVDHTAAETGVGAEASSAEKALGGVLTGSLADQSTAGTADKEAATSEDTEGYVDESMLVHVTDVRQCPVRERQYLSGRGSHSSFRAPAAYYAGGPLCRSPPSPSLWFDCLWARLWLPDVLWFLPHTGSHGRRCLQTWQPNSRRVPPPIPLVSSSSRRARGSRPPARQAMPRRSWAACCRRACHQRATNSK